MTPILNFDCYDVGDWIVECQGNKMYGFPRHSEPYELRSGLESQTRGS